MVGKRVPTGSYLKIKKLFVYVGSNDMNINITRLPTEVREKGFYRRKFLRVVYR